MRILPRGLKSLFSTPFTRKYPKVKVAPPEGFRGKHVYNKNKCIGCGLCFRSCPASAINFLDKEKKVEFDLTKCVFCGTCEEVCPVDAIRLSNEIVLSQAHKNLKIRGGEMK